MPAISSGTLFHFTDTLDNLLNILTYEFRPHFSLEDFSILSAKFPPTKDVHVAVPMVSFCDLPLSQIGNHMETYGYYALGLSKAWGMVNGLAPVLYTHHKAPTARAVLDLASHGKQMGQANQVLNHLVKLLFLSKPYEGKVTRRGQTKANVRFYDEREWRFIPIASDGSLQALSVSGYMDPGTRERANSQISEHRLSFTPSDIRYVIVQNENEILTIIREMERIKGSKYSADDVKILSSRVISSHQIMEDF